MKSGRTVSRRAAALGLAAAATTGLSRTTSAQSRPIATELQIDRINPRGLVQPRGYTQVVAAPLGRTLYISGQVSIDATAAIVGKGDMKAQVAQVFSNLRLALEGAGAGPRDVLKTNIYMVNPKAEDIVAFRDARNAFFAGVEPPASTFVGVVALANPDWLLEVEAVALVAPQATATLVR